MLRCWIGAGLVATMIGCRCDGLRCWSDWSLTDPRPATACDAPVPNAGYSQTNWTSLDPDCILDGYSEYQLNSPVEVYQEIELEQPITFPIDQMHYEQAGDFEDAEFVDPDPGEPPEYDEPVVGFDESEEPRIGRLDSELVDTEVEIAE